jgi:hypothetical protein
MVNATVVRPNECPDVFKGLGATQDFLPKRSDDLRILLQGLSGHGKTTFACSSPRTVVVDFDRAAECVAGGRAHRIAIPDFKTWMDTYKALLDDAKSGHPYFKRVVIDTADRWLDLEEAALCKDLSTDKNLVETIGDFGQKGAGYNKLYCRAMARLDSLFYVGYSWTVCCLLIEKEVTELVDGRYQSRTVIRPAIYPGMLRSIEQQSDYMMTVLQLRTVEPIMGTKAVKQPDGTVKDYPIKTGEQQVIQSSLRCSGDSEKQRVRLPSRIQLPITGGWDIFDAEYAKGVEAALANTKE